MKNVIALMRGVALLALFGLSACLEVETDRFLGEVDPRASEYVGTWRNEPSDQPDSQPQEQLSQDQSLQDRGDDAVYLAIGLEGDKTGRLVVNAAGAKPGVIYPRIFGGRRVVLLGEETDARVFSVYLIRAVTEEKIVASVADQEKFVAAQKDGNIIVSNPSWDQDNKHPILIGVSDGFDFSSVFKDEEVVVSRVDSAPWDEEKLKAANPPEPESTD